VYLIRQQARSESVNVARGSKVGWDERASCLRCHCGAIWIIGLAFWHPKKGPRRPALPRDQVPNRRQLAELRILEDRALRVQAGGVVAGQVETDSETRPLKTNLVAECTCSHLASPLQAVRVPDENCPIHGREEGGEETVTSV
jgi:hypothetical protein